MLKILTQAIRELGIKIFKTPSGQRQEMRFIFHPLEGTPIPSHTLQLHRAETKQTDVNDIALFCFFFFVYLVSLPDAQQEVRKVPPAPTNPLSKPNEGGCR